MKLTRPILLVQIVLVTFFGFAQKPVLVMPAGHAQKVSQIEVSHDFSFMASIDSTNTIIVWEIENKRELLHLREPGGSVVNIAFHPTENILVSSNSTGNIIYWDVTKGMITKRVKAHSKGSLLSFLSDGETLVSSSGSEIKLWNYQAGTVNTTIETEEPISAMAVGNAFKQITIGTNSGNVVSYGLEDYEKKWSINLSNPITYLSHYEGKPKVIVGTGSGEVASIHVVKKEIIEKKRVQSAPVNKLLIDESGGQIVIAGNDPGGYIKFLKSTSFDDDTIKKFDWSSTPKDKLGLFSLAWGDSTNTILLAGNHDNVIESWNRSDQTWDKIQFKGFSRPINSIDVNFNGDQLAVGSNQTRLKIIDLTGSRQPTLLKGHRGGITSVDFHPDRHRLVTVGRDQKITVWNPSKNEPIMTTKNGKGTTAFFTVNRKFVRKQNQKLEAYDFGKKDVKTVSTTSNNFKISSDGMQVAAIDKMGLTLYSPSLVQTNQIALPNLIDFSFSGDQILGLTSDSKVITIKNNALDKSFTIDRSVDKIFALKDGSFLVWSSKGANEDYSGYFYSSDGHEASELSGHQNSITDA